MFTQIYLSIYLTIYLNVLSSKNGENEVSDEYY